MKTITLHDKKFRPYIQYDRIMEAIDQVAARLNADFRGCSDVPILLCVLNGSVLFTSELMKRLDFDLELMTMKLSSYEGTASTGTVHEDMAITGDVRGRRVIVIEDIVDTGTTVVALRDKLVEKEAAEVRICTMLLKPEVYNKPLKLDYVGLEIPNRFIVGFGLDYDQLGRNYKDIYVIDS
ncbi:MAG: hypoxanthine phosphoribosyltransferase [Bacteroidales bacterium]|nr:hypoxanthine phosphoribosyltransferase [Bacteroidales bacterium]